MSLYSSNPMKKLENHLMLIEDVQNNCAPSGFKESLLFIEWSLELVFWNMMDLLYYDQVKYSSEILTILRKWNYEELYSKLSRSHQIMIDLIKMTDMHGVNPQVLYDKLLTFSEEINLEYDNCHASRMYKAYKRVKSLKK